MPKVRRMTDVYDEEIMNRILALNEGELQRTILEEDHTLETTVTHSSSRSLTDLEHLNDDLLEASEAGQRLEIASLIASGADPNYVDHEGYTPLIYATCKGKVSAMQELIYRGACVNFVAEDGTTCMHVAAQNLDEPALHCLLSETANPNIKHGKNGETALFLAAQRGNARIVQTLIDGGARVDKEFGGEGANAVYVCAQENFIEVLRILTAAGAPFDQKHPETKLTPLQAAVEHHRTLVARHLMGLGADVRIPFNDGTTVLMLCICNGDIDLVDAILHVKRDKKGPFHLDIQDREGFTAAHVAAEEGNWTVLKFIMAAGADMSLENKNGETAADVIEAEHGVYPDDVVPGMAKFRGSAAKELEHDSMEAEAAMALDEHKVMAILRESSMIDTKVHMVFKEVDLNGDGWLTEDELERALHDLGFKEIDGEFGELVHEKFIMLKSSTHQDRINFQDFEMIFNQAQDDYDKILEKKAYKEARAAELNSKNSDATAASSANQSWGVKSNKNKPKKKKGFGVQRYRSTASRGHVMRDVKLMDMDLSTHVEEAAPKIRKEWVSDTKKDVMALGFYTFKRTCELTQRRITEATRACKGNQAKADMCNMYKNFFKTQLEGLSKGVLDRGREIFKKLGKDEDGHLDFKTFCENAAPLLLEDFKGRENDLNGQKITLKDIKEDFEALDVDNSNTISMEELREYLLIVNVLLLSGVITKALDAITG